MGDIELIKKEGLLETTEELIMQKISKDTEIARILGIDERTAKKYKSIALRRMRNRAKKFNDLDKMLKQELSDLEYMEKKCWLIFRTSTTPNEQAGAMNSINKIKERRAKLLGFDTENVNQGKSKTLEDLLNADDIKEKENENKQRTNSGVVVDNKQAGAKSKVQSERGADEVREGENK